MKTIWDYIPVAIGTMVVAAVAITLYLRSIATTRRNRAKAMADSWFLLLQDAVRNNSIFHPESGQKDPLAGELLVSRHTSADGFASVSVLHRSVHRRVLLPVAAVRLNGRGSVHYSFGGRDFELPLADDDGVEREDEALHETVRNFSPLHKRPAA